MERNFQNEISDSFFREEVRKLNLHLPKIRKSLALLLSEQNPSVEALDGGHIYFKRSDLEILANSIPQTHHGDIKLPIVLLRRIELGKGVYIVSGEYMEKLLIRKLSGLTNKSFDDIGDDTDEVHLYSIQVQDLLNKLGSTLTIGFGISPDFQRE
ncbi:MAG: DUF61 family protein [Candidatus Bathyarchaeia archaeon]